MKYLLVGLTCITLHISAQIEVMIQPDAECGKDAAVYTFATNDNFGSDPGLSAVAWEENGFPEIRRFFLQFDFSDFPPGTQISNAVLTLYYRKDDLYDNSASSGTNAMDVYRVNSGWNENNVTWNNQPGFDSIIAISGNLSPGQSLELDMTSEVQFMIDFPNLNDGWLFKLNDETYYRSVVFASSDEKDPLLRPRITITVADSVQIKTCLKPVEYCFKDIDMPNIFSPNTDDQNQHFRKLLDASCRDVEFIVYNRWGEAVFHNVRLSWDGTTDVGMKAPEGMYFYVVSRGEESFSGFMSLIR